MDVTHMKWESWITLEFAALMVLTINAIGEKIIQKDA